MSSPHDDSLGLNLTPDSEGEQMNDVSSKADPVRSAFSLANSQSHVLSAVKVFNERELIRIKNDPNLEHTLGRDATEGDKAIEMPKDVTALYVTTQPKKPYRMKLAVQEGSADIRFETADPVLHWVLSAKETSKTYTGNCYEKIEQILNRIYDDIGYDEVASRLKQYGYDPENTLFIINDEGFHFNQDFSQEPEFAAALKEHEGREGKRWPGVELAPIINSLDGRRNYDELIGKMVARKAQSGEAVDLTARDNVTYMAFRLKPEREQVQIVTSFASAPVEYILQYKPNDGLATEERREVPLNHNLPDHMRGKTMQEIGDEYFKKYAAPAVAMQNLVKALGIQPSAKNALANASKPKSRKQKFRVVTPHNVLPDLDEVKVSPFPDGDSRKLKTSNHVFDHEKKKVFAEMAKHSRGFVLGEHSDEVLEEWDSYWPHLRDFFFSLVVERGQLGVEEFTKTIMAVLDSGKPFKSKSLNPHQAEKEHIEFIRDIDPKKNPWLKAIEFTRYLIERGFVKQELQFLFDQYDPDDPLLRKKLRASIKEHAALPDREIPEYEKEKFGFDRTDLFEVTVFGSASTRVTQYTEEAEELGYWMASMGFHVRTGGGGTSDFDRHTEGVMEAVSRGVLKFMRENPDLAKHCHLTAIQMPRTINVEGALPDPEMCKSDENQTMRNKGLFIEPSFCHRMGSLFRSDSCIAMAPGIGTYQEIDRYLGLYRDGRLNGGRDNNKLMLYNQVQANGNPDVRLMDCYIEGMMSESEKTDVDIILDLDTIKANLCAQYEKKFGHAPVSLFERARKGRLKDNVVALNAPRVA